MISKKIKIVVTGANGFLAKNLILSLNEKKIFKIYKIFRKTNYALLKKALISSDFIFHLASENRSNKKYLFFKNNYQFTKKICKILNLHQIRSPIFFASSTQVNLNNIYARTKKKAEKIILDHARTNRIKVSILRLPNIFGKWSKPDYNSFVSTLCYRIPRNKTFLLKNKILKLVYIDDVVSKLISLLKKKNVNKYEKVQPCYKVSVKKIFDLINKFNSIDLNFFSDNLSYGFEKKLYSTFLTFLPKSRWTYKSKVYKDHRGQFSEFLKTKNSGQISSFSIRPNKTRGEHYHQTKNEVFLILKGRVKILFKHILTKKKYSFTIDANDNIIFKSIPGWAHSIKNITSNDVLGIIWANEIFNFNKPDTVKFKL